MCNEDPFDDEVLDEKYEKMGDNELIGVVHDSVSSLFASDEPDMGYAVDELITRYHIVVKKYNDLRRETSNV